MRGKTLKVIGLPRAIQIAQRWSVNSEMSPLNLKWSLTLSSSLCIGISRLYCG